MKCYINFKILGVMILCLYSCKQDNEIRSNEYLLFKESPLWELANATMEEDINEIKRIGHQKDVNLNFQESTFGNTLLMLTVKNQNYNSCKALLEIGADPNIHDHYNGSSPIIEAADIENYYNDNTSFLKLLLAFNANPNDEEIGDRRPGNTTRKTPLLIACSDVNQMVSPINKVKLLVEAGANINYRNEFNQFPLCEALMFKHFDVVLYLLQRGAEYNGVFIDRTQYGSEGKKLFIADMLREILLPLDSKEYQEKMEVVNFLETHGINYRNTPIPDYVTEEAKKKYPDTWKDYLEKY